MVENVISKTCVIKMNMKKQTSFNFKEDDFNIKTTHGGSLSLGKRKTRRPLDSRKPIHLVIKATNSYTLLKNKGLVEQVIHRFSVRFGMKLYAKAVQHDHIHLCLSFQNRSVYKMWIRAVSGTLVKTIKGLKFKLLPFTRVIGASGKDLRCVQNYINKNQAEADFLEKIHRRMELSDGKIWSDLRNFALQRGGTFQNLMNAKPKTQINYLADRS